MRRLERVLRWYPQAWRERYGEEFLALLEDELAGAAPRPLFLARIALSGLRERAHASGIVGAASADVRRRSGSLLVLVAWAGMLVGAAGLSKSAEHFASALPVASRTGAQVAYDAVVAAGVGGTLLVCLGALFAAPSFARFLHRGGWISIRRPVKRALLSSAASAFATLGLGVWAHHLTTFQRNGGDAHYGAAFAALAVLATLTIALWTAAIVGAVAAMSISPALVRAESWLAGAVAVAGALVTSSALAWWVEMGRHAPWFFQGASDPVSAWPVPMTLSMAIMVVSSVLAVGGVIRIASARLVS